MSETIGRVFTPEKDWFGIDWATGNKGEQKRRQMTKDNIEAGEKAKKEAEQTALLQRKREEEKSATRRAMAAKPTSGFGANTNVARTFLTSL